MSGQSCMVHESLTDDQDRILSSLGKISSEGEMHIIEGLKIARLALMSKGTSRGQRKILILVCSPVQVSEEELASLEILLRKEGVGIDFVNIGNPENDQKMKSFIESINKRENCTYFSIGEKDNMIDYLQKNYLQTNSTNTGSNQNETMDPDMELALRLSLEEENARRQGTGEGTVENDEIDEDLALAMKLSLEYENSPSGV
ncbi:hypothetical protein XU18_3468 [Perkinsela sp. CCAP 1560/4]|nr:hypothetical protein XU18_3468 [Perkinsela sp. CCAP 1560/4]|eukprot:KNH05497.1 hypothetical protein XU18_3468 [Perkinsela sp. CCAP 1560/4]